MNRLSAVIGTVLFNICPSNSVFALDALDAAFQNSQITYSNNARNLMRVGAGDFSQGFQDVSTSSAAKKRRAMKGCKSEIYRLKADMNEKDCTHKILDGDVDFMLKIIAEDENADINKRKK
jgi:hypothetical protein